MKRKGMFGIDDDLLSMKKRISDWLSDDTLKDAIGKTKEEIIDMYGNELEPIAYIPKFFANLIDSDLDDFYVYSGKGYFVDHAVNHHSNISTEKYILLQDVLNDPDEIVKTTVDKHDSYVFIKKIDRYNAVVLTVEKTTEGKMILHKSFFNQKKKPYANVGIRLYPFSSEAGDLPLLQESSSIIRTDETVHGRSLPALDDDANKQNIFDINKSKGRKESIDGIKEQLIFNAKLSMECASKKLINF